MRKLLSIPLLALPLIGCGPSLDHLVETHNYGEALCRVAVHDPGPDEERRLRNALHERLDPALYLHALDEGDLRPALGDRTGRVLERAVLIQMEVDRHEAYVNLITELELRRLPARSTPQALPKITDQREALALLTGESLPHGKTTGSRPSELATFGYMGLRGMAALGELVTLGTLPFRDLLGPPPRDTTQYHPPSDADYQAQSPKTEALYQSDVALWQRPDSSARTVELVLRWQWMQYSTRSGDCTLDGEAHIELPPAATLEERINRRFAGRWIRFRDL